ncbi:hypothetical protein G4B88_026290 [Cannabis sativa]|uniref:Uncharacterized protein n=1 Tax=Cannabis sativa TaxID=3483 RepID=A0A7J6FUH3_CANSA|nr:hypothetical protein G4B88_026290 [Cannabis sativa]
MLRGGLRGTTINTLSTLILYLHHSFHTHISPPPTSYKLAIIYSNIEKKINGVILNCAILGYIYKLSCLDNLWAPFYSSRKEKMIKVVLVVLAELTLNLTHFLKKRSTIVGTICILFNILIYAAPLAVMKLVITTKSVETTFIQIWKRKSMEQYSTVPYLATLINCLVWTLYGLPFIHPGSILVVTINGSGLVIELTYLLII